MRIGLLELVALVTLGVWLARRTRAGSCPGFDQAWIGFGIGVALMFSRSFFWLGAVLAGACAAAITLPMARVEWRRRVADESGAQGPVGYPPARERP